MNLPRFHSHRRAFTLVELLVVIGVIALLAGILLPMVLRSSRQAARMRVQGDMQAISAALEAYKQEFFDYPRLPVDANGVSIPDTGAATLGKALIGTYGTGATANDPPTYVAGTTYKPGDCVNVGGSSFFVALVESTGAPTTDLTKWAAFNPRDGADGPGFRLRGNQGKVFGPYLQPGKVAFNGTDVLDHYGNPILYFPARPGKVNVAVSATPQPYVDRADSSLYDANHNIAVFRRPGESDTNNALSRIRIMLGDATMNGYIDSSFGAETASQQPFLLWSAGPDGVFGPAGYELPASMNAASAAANRKAVESCDDVGNFR